MDTNEIIEMIDYVEDKDATINPKCFYHGTSYSLYALDKIEKMLLKGIKCPILTLKRPGAYNGLFYISVSNLEKGIEDDGSAFNRYLYKKDNLMFILSEDTPVADTKYFAPLLNHVLGTICQNTPIPFRTSCYLDEYQVLGKISPKYYVGLEFLIRNLLERKRHNIVDSKELFNSLYLLVELMNEKGIDLPIYDYSTNREINKDKVLKLELLK